MIPDFERELFREAMLAEWREEQEKLIFDVLDGEDFEYTHLWTPNHLLEVRFKTRLQMDLAKEIMEFELPTEVQTFFCMRGEKMLVFVPDSFE